MSATIYWNPVVKKNHCLETCLAPSSFIEAMTEAFGNEPWTIESQSDIDILRGMQAAKVSGVAELLGIAYKHRPLKIWPEY